jgi:hypothetical protein
MHRANMGHALWSKSSAKGINASSFELYRKNHDSNVQQCNENFVSVGFRSPPAGHSDVIETSGSRRRCVCEAKSTN